MQKKIKIVVCLLEVLEGLENLEVRFLFGVWQYHQLDLGHLPKLAWQF